MKLVNNIDEKRQVYFKNLKVGTAYFDKDGAFCIKVDDRGSLFFDAIDDWAIASESPSAAVQPLDVTITINGYL